MNVSTTDVSPRELFAVRRLGGWYVPGVAVLTSTVTVAVLLSVIPGPVSTVTGWTLTADASPIAEAGGVSQPVVGFFQFGLARIYVPVLSLLLVVGGETAAVLLGRFRVLAPLVAGIGAGTQPMVVTGCGCGYGTAGTSTTLLAQALGAGLL
jgi:hypothetical protein